MNMKVRRVDNPRSAQSYFALLLGELAAFQKASYAVAYVLRASDAFPQLLGFPLDGGHLGDAPQPLRCCEVLTLAFRLRPEILHSPCGVGGRCQRSHSGGCFPWNVTIIPKKHSVWSGEILPKFGFALDVIVEARIKNLTTCRQRQTPLHAEVS